MEREPTLQAATTILRSPGQKRRRKWPPNLTPQAGPCKAQDIGFAPWFPLASGDLAKPGTLLDGIAKARRASPGQVELAWLPRRSPVMLPIPGTARVRHLEQNIAAAVIFKRKLRGA